jgi:hypothetical protein
MVLVAAWFAVVAVASLVAVRSRPQLRLPAIGTFAAIAVATGAIGYWTGFRDRTVDERVVMAARDATATERDAALAGAPGRATAPLRVASGALTGADGHRARGRAAIIREPGGTRRLTLTDFDADPGPGVVVYLARDESNVDDVVELGDLKGNVGDQQYRIPDGANLQAYDTLILWCVPFTTRIAVALLS